MDKNIAGPSKPPSEYDAQIRSAIPFYEDILQNVLELIFSIKPHFSRWLDTGCGTGNLILKFALEYTKMMENPPHIYLADPSQEMLDIAQIKISQAFLNYQQLKNKITFLPKSGTQDIEIGLAPFSIITAVQAHHYMNKQTRIDAIKRCYDILEENGILIITENIRPVSDFGIKNGLDRWNHKQKMLGLGRNEIDAHRARFDQKYFPITIVEHLDILKKTGFRTIELFWYSYMQAGFYAIK